MGIIGWSLLSTVLLAVAASTPLEPKLRWLQRVNTALIVSLALWLTFFIADQVVMKFGLVWRSSLARTARGMTVTDRSAISFSSSQSAKAWT